jgi:hypothetical protein
MTAGHLRSQIRHLSVQQSLALDAPGLVVRTRTSNALDFALLVQDLVPLLEAYERACHTEDAAQRLELASAICQGVSPDADLFVNRIVLLGAYSMIEHVFITTNPEGSIEYTPLGRRHLHMLDRYEELMARLAKSLSEDCRRFRPLAGTYSPFGVLYGFTSHLLEHMALKASQPDAETRFSLEDVFVCEDAVIGKLDWVKGWRKLPHLTREVEQRFDYPQQFAEEIFERLDRALSRRAAATGSHDVEKNGKLLIESSDAHAGTPANPVTQESERVVRESAAGGTDLPVRYVVSSDAQQVAAQNAAAYDETRLLNDRQEGKFLVSYQTSGGWVAITKDVLTEMLGAEDDVHVRRLPASAAQVLQLMCPRLVSLPNESPSPARELDALGGLANQER